MVSHITLLVSCGLLLIYRASGKDCDADQIGVAMLSCQEERETLSDASRLNDTAQLCRALQKYSECIGPTIADCQGEAMLAFNVIKQQYASAPYNCHITDPWNDADTQFQNDVNSQLHNDDDNHIVTNGPVDTLGAVTVAVLPSKTDAVKDEQPETDVKQPETDITTSTSTATDPQQDADTTSNAAPSSLWSYPASFIIAAVVITRLTTLLFL